MTYLPEALLVLVCLPWLAYALRIGAETRGRFFRLTGSATGRAELEAVRQMGLGFAGLLFAGIAVGVSPSFGVTALGTTATDPLVIGLACTLVAWIVTNLGTYVWVAYLSGALITVSVGALIVGVAELTRPAIGTEVKVVLALALVAVVGFSLATARTYWLASRVACPPTVPTTANSG